MMKKRDIEIIQMNHYQDTKSEQNGTRQMWLVCVYLTKHCTDEKPLHMICLFLKQQTLDMMSLHLKKKT